MPTLSIRNQLLLGAFLILLLVTTRGHNALSFDLIPASTIGLFFFAWRLFPQSLGADARFCHCLGNGYYWLNLVW